MSSDMQLKSATQPQHNQGTEAHLHNNSGGQAGLQNIFKINKNYIANHRFPYVMDDRFVALSEKQLPPQAGFLY